MEARIVVRRRALLLNTIDSSYSSAGLVLYSEYLLNIFLELYEPVKVYLSIIL